MTAPDHYLPMFGDTTLDVHHSPDFTAGDVGARLFHEPEYGLLARHDFGIAPKVGNRAFPQAGMFFFRSGWKPDDIYFALHNSPPALSRHDQPDNGTFELYAFGRWLMPDSGSFAYDNTPHDNEREWFRQTRVHQTLTLDGKNSVNASHTQLWKEVDRGAVLTVDNASYPGLIHRRTVFFVDRRYFVLVDEAIGNAKGTLDLHFQFAPGPFLDNQQHRLTTMFPDGGNVVVWEPADMAVDTVAEEGQVSSKFNIKEARPAVAYRARTGAPFVYLTVLVPYNAKNSPSINADFLSSFAANDSSLKLRLSVDGERWFLSRDLKSGTVSVKH
jgi:heparan-sulfate lyase